MGHGGRMRGEPEVGSVIETRTAGAERVQLGQVKRTCEVCGREWIGPDYCHQGNCRSIMFTERDVRPSPAMTILGRGISAVAEPLKPNVLAEPGDIQTMRDLRAVLVESDARLDAADTAARRLVNVNVSNFE